MKTIHPVVIRGGFGRNKDKSIKSGAFLLEILSKKYFDPVDLLVDDEGWFVEGKKIKEADIYKLGNVFISTLAEDNHKDFDIRRKIEGKRHFLGSSTVSSLLSFNKNGAKEIFNSDGIKTPRHRLYEKEENLQGKNLEIFHSFGLPVILKPVSSNYSVGVTLAHNLTELQEKLEELFTFSDKILAEEFIEGKEVSCLILENFRNQSFYAFPLGEIVREEKISTEEIKRNSKYRVMFPARITLEESRMARELAQKAHEAIGLSHYSRADLIISPKGVYLLEINSSPEIDKYNLFSQSLDAGGVSTEAFLEHTINLAIDRR